GFVVFVNLLLRPIVSFINRQPLVSSEVETGYLIALTCRAEDEAHIRALLLQGLAGGALALRGLDSNDLNATGRVRVTAHLTALTGVLLGGGAAQAQVPSISPGLPLGITSPLGIGPAAPVGPTRIPLGATELATPGASPILSGASPLDPLTGVACGSALSAAA